jgi:hypothetical protein
MTDDAEWRQVGTILYTDSHEIPRLKIVNGKHTYEIQECKFHPIMRVFSVLVDGEFHASVHDSFERLMKLDEVSKSDKCSEKEHELTYEITKLKGEIVNLTKEIERIKMKYNDARVIIFDGV